MFCLLLVLVCPILGSSLSPAHCQPICFSSLCLLKVRKEISSLLPPPSLVCSEHPAPSAECPFQFLAYFSGFFFFFCGVGVSLPRGLCWFIPEVAVGIPHAAYLLTCESESPKQVRSQHLSAREPSCFLSVTWHGEALYGLGVQGVRVWILFFFFSQVWLQRLSKIFDLQSSCCLLLPSGCHLGSLLFFSLSFKSETSEYFLLLSFVLLYPFSF
jgi:hypothetical protein